MKKICFIVSYLIFSRASAQTSQTEIAHAVSGQPTGPWQYQATVLEGRGGNHWDGITTHNPKIKYFAGKYYLYYIATQHPEGSLDQDGLKEIAATGYQHPDWKPLWEAQRTGVAVKKDDDSFLLMMPVKKLLAKKIK